MTRAAAVYSAAAGGHGGTGGTLDGSSKPEATQRGLPQDHNKKAT